MKKIFTLAICLLGINEFASAQADCTGGRYTTYNLFSQVNVTSNVVFGNNNAVGGGPVDLKMDVYEPAGDTETNRPVVIMAFGGSFVSGSKSDVASLCNLFAKLGYVAVAPDYRVGLFSPNQRTTTLAVLRGAHDVKACVRYLKKTVAEDGNPYGIDCGRIIVGGVSAGAISAIHAAYLDKLEETPSYLLPIDTAGLGGIEGNSGTPDYPSDPLGVLSFSGAIGDTSWIEAGDAAICSIHEENDETVPYLTQEVAVFGIPTGLIASGSAHVHVRAENVGIENDLMTYWGVANHVGYLSPFDQAAKDFARDFCAALVCSGESNDCESSASGIHETVEKNTLGVYPNPATSELNFNSEYAGTATVIDVTGREIFSTSTIRGSVKLDISGLVPGFYTLILTGDKTSTALFVKQ